MAPFTRRLALAIGIALACGGLSGCVMIEVGVTNPVPGLTTVAVAPFFNLSEERAVDGRRFAMAYFSELQKTPGYQVVPVGVVEQTINEHKLEMSNPNDALRLANLLNVDAVVVGAITDYSPYYPPRIGLQVSWYSPKSWTFSPGIPVDDQARAAMSPKKQHHWNPFSSVKPQSVPLDAPASADCNKPRGQSPRDRADASGPQAVTLIFEPAPQANAVEPTQYSQEPPINGSRRFEIPQNGSRDGNGYRPNPATRYLPASRQFPLENDAYPSEQTQTLPLNPPEFSGSSSGAGDPALCNPPTSTSLNGAMAPAVPFDPTQPLMSYTRMFDGADAMLVAKLRDYVELSGDQRSGGWKGYLQRSEDFIRFSAHVMVVEMLQLHGGEAKRRVVVKSRKYK